MATFPVGADIANFGFGSAQQNAYLASPQFQTNTTYGDMMGISGPNGIGGFGTTGIGQGGMGGLFSLDGLKLLGGGISTLGNLYNSFQAQKLARESFNFQKNFANKNLSNQIASYNTALDDRARSRGVAEGQSQQQVDDYIAKNRLTK